MRIASVDLPPRLLEARRSGRLVVFAGAGISRREPSNLPDFESLAKEIAEGALEPKEKEPPDHFLGRLAQLGVPVHERAARILDPPDSRPNESHWLLVDLFSKAENLRLVTTNFDRHFESVIAARWPSESIDIYSAPALPVGSRFSGLAYVHGRLGRHPHDLVLTDGDFGRAYLTEGWARRFLADIFSTYDVLFVGYSHQDLVLSYLARGLPATPDRMRFALAGYSDPEPERWQFLGIQLIEYDPTDNHSALLAVLRDWRDLEGRGALSHEREVQQLVARPSQALTEQEEDYLLFCLSDPKLAQFFYRHAHDPTWLTWAFQRSILSPLFKPSEDFDEGAEPAEWFARDPLSERGEVARQLAYQAKDLARRLRSQIAHAIWRALDGNNVSQENAQHAAQWLAILERHDRTNFDHGLIAHWLKSLSARDHTFLAVHLFEYLTRPVVVAERKLRYREDDSWEEELAPVVKIRGDRWLQESWGSLFAPNLDLFVNHVAPLVFGHLQRAHLLLRDQGGASGTWDPLSYGRPAIEPHEQNTHGSRDAFYILVDAARDIIDWWLREDPAMARHYIEVGLTSEAPLVLRLCIYGLSRHPGMSANAKIAAVVDRGWLENWLLKHEVFQLLRGSYKDSRPTMRRRLLRAAEHIFLHGEGAAVDPADERYYLKLFELLLWLEASDPSCPLVAKALRSIRTKYPDFKISSYPDFGHWSSGFQTVQVVSPVPKDNLLRLGPAQWITEYIRVTNAERDQLTFEDPVQGFLLETENAASQDFDWGLELVRHLAAEGAWGHVVWHYILRSWAKQPLTESQWNDIISLVQHQELLQHANDIADLLMRRIENRDSVATEAMVGQAFRLAETLWGVLGSSAEADQALVNDWVQYGIGRADGKLGLFAAHALSRLRSIHEEDWRDIPGQFLPLLEKMANASGNVMPSGRVMLCSQLHFFFAIDPGWTKVNLIPLFDWATDRQIAEQAWHGFLSWGLATRELLVEFMPCFMQTFDYLADLKSKRSRFSEYLARITYDSPNLVAAGWIREYLRKSILEDRKEWMNAIGSILDDLEGGDRRTFWETWLRQYVELRLDSEVPIEDDEWRAVINWSLRLGEILPDVVALLGRRRAPQGIRDIFYYRLHKQEDLLQQPEALVDLLLYVLSGEERLYHDCTYVIEIADRLLGTNTSRLKLRDLAERLGELGCSEAQEFAARVERT